MDMAGHTASEVASAGQSESPHHLVSAGDSAGFSAAHSAWDSAGVSSVEMSAGNHKS